MSRKFHQKKWELILLTIIISMNTFVIVGALHKLFIMRGIL